MVYPLLVDFRAEQRHAPPLRRALYNNA